MTTKIEGERFDSFELANWLRPKARQVLEESTDHKHLHTTSSTQTTTHPPVSPTSSPESPTSPITPMAENNNPPQGGAKSWWSEKLLNHRFKTLITRYETEGWGTVATNDFQLQPLLVNVVQMEQFAGGDHDDPNAHLISFLDVCATIIQNGVSPDTLRMRMFGFSLMGKARDWHKGLDWEKVITWKELCRLFLEKYSPSSKAEKILEFIYEFEQYEDESLYEAWTRFKQLLRTGGLTIPTKKELYFAALGGFLNSDVDEALDVIERMAVTSYECSTNQKLGKKKSAAINIDAYADLMEKYAKLQREFNAQKKGKFHVNDVDEESNAQLVEEVNYFQGNFRQGQGYPRGNQAYNPNNQNHQHFSYTKPQQCASTNARQCAKRSHPRAEEVPRPVWIGLEMSSTESGSVLSSLSSSLS